jgi:hypothetical protein
MAVFFEQYRSTRGYEIQIGVREWDSIKAGIIAGESGWRAAIRRNEEFVVPNKRNAPVSRVRLPPEAFRKFAVDPDPKTVCSLAGEFGPLYSLRTFFVTSKGNNQTQQGCPVLWCKDFLSAMKNVVQVLNLIDAGDLNDLARFIFWDKKAKVFRIEWGDRHKGPFWGCDIDARFAKPDDLMAAAKILIHERISLHLEDEVALKCVVSQFEGRSQFEYRPFPKNLAGALWLQLADYIAQGNAAQRCAHCRTWFRPQRTTRKFCENKCRAAWHRKQQSGGRVPLD